MVDLGCGNGCFANKFTAHIAPTYQIQSCICVDPYPEWLNGWGASTYADNNSHITKTLCMNAFDFSQMPQQQMNYSHLLMKEMIHHLDESTLLQFFNGIIDQLDEQQDGTVVIITRPNETNYPFFERIHELWKSTQIPYENVVVHMKNAGFDVSVEMATLPVTLQKQEWISFIEKKTWSVFSMCSEEEMVNGLNQLQNDLDGGTISFLETLIFIVGRCRQNKKSN